MRLVTTVSHRGLIVGHYGPSRVHLLKADGIVTGSSISSMLWTVSDWPGSSCGSQEQRQQLIQFLQRMGPGSQEARGLSCCQNRPRIPVVALHVTVPQADIGAYAARARAGIAARLGHDNRQIR